MSLTDIAIKKAKISEKPYRLKDSGGMFLFVTPAGGKLWRWKYRFDSKQKLMTPGKYPWRERSGKDPLALAGLSPLFRLPRYAL
jgi:hypothetical protein